MTAYSFDKSNHFFDEVLAFSAMFLGLQGLDAYRRANHEIERVVRWSEIPPPRPHLTLRNVAIPDNHEGPGRVVSCTLTNAKHIVESFQQFKQVNVIRYVDEALVTTDIEPNDRVINLGIMPSMLSVILTLPAQIALNGAYEKVGRKIISKWGRNPLLWPPILQYFRHIRNACSHGNRFDIRGNPGIASSNSPKWRSSQMLDKASMNGKSLFGDWWELGDVPIFLGDVNFFLKMHGIYPSR